MAGLPGIDTLDSYGGALSNYAPVEDATTDEDAAHRNLYAMNVAGMTQTAARAVRRFVGHAATPTDPVSGFVHGAVWGSDNALKPTVGIAATVYTITWPTEVEDALGETHTVNLRYAKAWVETTGATLYVATARVATANTVEVRVYSDFSTLSAAAGLHIVVEAH
jgi:hypothetical protein